MYVREYHPLSTCHFISMLWMKPGLFRAEHTYGVNNRITLRLKEKGGQHLKRGKVKKRAWWKGLPAVVREKSSRRRWPVEKGSLPYSYSSGFSYWSTSTSALLYTSTSTRLEFYTGWHQPGCSFLPGRRSLMLSTSILQLFSSPSKKDPH